MRTEQPELNTLAYRKLYSAYCYIAATHRISPEWHATLNLLGELREQLVDGVDGVCTSAMIQVWDEIDGKYICVA